MRTAASLANLPSVDIIIDPNPDNWTRAAVFEAEDNPLLSEGGVQRGELRRALSVDKQGRNQLDPDCVIEEATFDNEQLIGSRVSEMRAEDIEYLQSVVGEDNDVSDFSFGMGWFPGYAIDVETGERLNIAFAENSWLGSQNGADMQWNPTSDIVEELFGELRLGGMHMIYVFRSNKDDGSETEESDLLMPAYDGGQFIFDNMLAWDPTDVAALLQPSNELNQRYLGVMRAAAWVGYPLVAPTSKLFGESGENKVAIRLRSSKPYEAYTPVEESFTSTGEIQAGETYYVKAGEITVDQEQRINVGDSVEINIVEETFYRGDAFTAIAAGAVFASTDIELATTINRGLPLYNFSTDDVAPTMSAELGIEALDQIKVVPNPYYAYSKYEQTRLEYLVKIINLPQTCTVNIFTVNGTLVRTFRKDDASVTSIDWDLKNQDNITVASGLYIMHIEVPGVGEKVIKWFGVLRPIDLNSF